MNISSELFAELYELEESLWRAKDRYSREKMEPVFSTDFFEFGRSGRTYNREQIMPTTKSGGDIPIELPLIDFKARWLAENVVQTTYISKVHYADGLEVANRSSIWSNLNGRWEIRFHQGTAVL